MFISVYLLNFLSTGRGTVTDINRNVADTLRLCGPAILNSENTITQFTETLIAIIS